MINFIIEVANKTKRTINSLHNRSIKIKRQLEYYEGELKMKKSGSIGDEQQKQNSSDEKIEELKKKAG
jgi:hypothetical protein